jgi:hypothetical protein
MMQINTVGTDKAVELYKQAFDATVGTAWEWRMRVLDERDDIAYSKVFFRKAGYITREWYPYFLAVRRKGLTFDETYADGVFSHEAKRIYEVLREGIPVPLHGAFATVHTGYSCF